MALDQQQSRRHFVLYFLSIFVLFVDAMMHDAKDECIMVKSRVITFEELKVGGLRTFTSDAITDFSQVVVDQENEQLLVGAKDYLLTLRVEDLSVIMESDWRPSPLMKDICISKGERMEDCCNFVRVLLPYKDKVLTCGTNAFSPLCTWRKRTNITEVERQVSGIARCPYDPKYNGTALITQEGDLYTGTVMDFTARDPVVYRTLGHSPALRTPQFNSKWLNEPSFVASYEIGPFVYFFFREVAVEHSQCGQVIYSRVARVCKNDVGGEFLLEENWTTFLKARLNCSIPGKYPFYFNELQSTFYSEEAQTVYGVFSTSGNGMHGSAVCAFNLEDIEASFRGAFKYQPDTQSVWITHRNEHQNFNCSGIDEDELLETFDTEDHLIAAQKYQLMDQTIPFSSEHPLFISNTEHIDRILVDHVSGKEGMYDVFFLGTSEGKVKKVVNIPGVSEPCVLEELCVTPKPICEPMNELRLHPGQGALYAALPNAIVKIPVERCGSFATEVECIEARDPYCGWNAIRKQCTRKPKMLAEINHWHQNITSCPVVSNRVDGGFSDWTEWSPCDDPSGILASCMCRTRQCNNPAPKCGGSNCGGETVQVQNCSGRKHDTNDVDKGLTADHWTDWTTWSVCSERCGGGMQSRYRRCLSSTRCIGESREVQPCNTEECAYRRKATMWTPWLVWNISDDGVTQQRFRFICRATVKRKTDLDASGPKSETRFCPSLSRKCFDEANHFGGWSAWSPWLPCSVTCGDGMQVRHRSCFPGSADCFGHYYEQRKCSYTKCPVDGGWSCWSPWSECSATCGAGVRRRERQCNEPAPSNGGVDCEGEASEEEMCDAGDCMLISSMNWGIEVRSGDRDAELEPNNGWKKWSKWTKCNPTKGKRHRSRKCGVGNPTNGLCEGCVKEIQWCNAAGDKPGSMTFLRPDVQRLVAPPPVACPLQATEADTAVMIVVGCFSAIAGAVMTLAVYISWQSKRKPPDYRTTDLDDPDNDDEDVFDEEDMFEDDSFSYEDYPTHVRNIPLPKNPQEKVEVT